MQVHLVQGAFVRLSRKGDIQYRAASVLRLFLPIIFTSACINDSTSTANPVTISFSFLLFAIAHRAFSAATVADVAVRPRPAARPTDRPPVCVSLPVFQPPFPLGHCRRRLPAVSNKSNFDCRRRRRLWRRRRRDVAFECSSRVFPTSCFPIVSWGSSPTDRPTSEAVC